MAANAKTPDSPSTILIGVARSDRFSARVSLLALNSAITVADENAQVPDHDSRIKFADAILQGSYNMKLLAGVVLRDPSSSIAAAAIADAANDAEAVADASISAEIDAQFTAIGKSFA